MLCKTIILGVALAGHYPGTCVLQCDIRNAWVGITSDDRRHGTIRDEHGWFDVHDWGNGSRRWVWIAEQEPKQCERGGLSRP